MIRVVLRGSAAGAAGRSSGSSLASRTLSHEPPDAPLPESVAAGAEPFLIVGAMAGG